MLRALKALGVTLGVPVLVIVILLGVIALTIGCGYLILQLLLRVYL